MTRVTLPFRWTSQQALTTVTSFVVTALSASLTVAAACKHWPAALGFAVWTAATCELCKVTLFWTGLAALHGATTWLARTLAVARVALACLFATLSVGASIMCMSQAEEALHRQTLYNSRAYESATERVRGIDRDLATLRVSAEKDMTNNYIKRGREALDRVNALSAERAVAEAELLSLEQKPVQSMGTALPHALTLAGITAPLASVNFVLELIIGSAIEIAGLLFLCGTAASSAQPKIETSAPEPPTDPVPPRPTRAAPRNRLPAIMPPRISSIVRPAPTTSRFGATAPTVTEIAAKTANNATCPAPAEIPATYGKWLRFLMGQRLEARLQQLESERCYGACRDLLQRMGEHCLRTGWTNGTVDAATIRARLRSGRDWRTVKGYLARLALVGAVIEEGGTYTIAHFLEYNPSVQRREARLEDLRSKACKRQRKVRRTLQSLQPEGMQKVDLTASRGSRHAQKPQPTTHAFAAEFPAAHAASHQPTELTLPHFCDSRQSDGVGTRAQRVYGAVVPSSQNEEDDKAWFERLAVAERRGSRPKTMPSGEAAAVADEFERSLKPSFAEANTGSSEDALLLQDRPHCIAARIPTGTPLVNLHDVSQACRKIGLPEFGRQCDALFKRLSADAVRQAELSYAAWCTKHAIEEGNLRKSAVGLMLDIIRRQRLQTQDPSAA